MQYTPRQKHIPATDTSKQSVEALRERSWEHDLPPYLQHDLDAYKDGLKSHSGLMDCLWGELYGSINMAEISDGIITSEHANYLRKKYLYGARI